MTPKEVIRISCGLIALVVLCMALYGCGENGPVGTPTETASVVELTPLPTIAEVAAAASVTTSAVRLVPPVTVTAAPVDYDALADAEYAEFTCGMFAGEALEAGWPREQLPKVLRTMYRESNCLPHVRSTTSDSGLMQINDIVLRDHRFKRDWPGFYAGDLFDPLTNLRVAHWVWTIDGWTPWRGGA
jgi:hypothetical protein